MFDTLLKTYEAKLAADVIFSNRSDLIDRFIQQSAEAYIEVGDCQTASGRTELLALFNTATIEYLNRQQDVFYAGLREKAALQQLQQDYRQHMQARDLLRATFDEALGALPVPDGTTHGPKKLRLTIIGASPPDA